MRLLLLYLNVNKANACPFCEWGASDAAYFMVTFLGLFILSMTVILFAFLKSGAMSKANLTSLSVLEAEGIKQKESSHES